MPKQIPVTYQRVLLTRFGNPAQAFQIVEDILPEPGEGQVRIRVLAAGVAFADLMMRRGQYPRPPRLPFTPGHDVVGVVDALGPGVGEFVPGQMVAALTIFGGYSQSICLPAAGVAVVPEGVDPVEASALPLNYLTAYQLLHRAARVMPGERILVHGAAGGIGTALLQLARLAGLEAYGTASPSKLRLVQQSGATAIDYRSEDVVARVRALTDGGVDAVFDGIGGAHLDQSFQALRKGGRLVSYGLSALPPGITFRRALVPYIVPHLLRIALWSAIPNGKKVTMHQLDGPVTKKHPEWIREDLRVLLDLLSQRKIAPIVVRLPLQEVASAHELLEHAQVQGKLVLLPNPSLLVKSVGDVATTPTMPRDQPRTPAMRALT